jgi:hypothetical protein
MSHIHSGEGRCAPRNLVTLEVSSTAHLVGSTGNDVTSFDGKLRQGIFSEIFNDVFLLIMK